MDLKANLCQINVVSEVFGTEHKNQVTDTQLDELTRKTDDRLNKAMIRRNVDYFENLIIRIEASFKRISLKDVGLIAHFNDDFRGNLDISIGQMGTRLSIRVCPDSIALTLPDQKVIDLCESNERDNVSLLLAIIETVFEKGFSEYEEEKKETDLFDEIDTGTKSSHL